MSLIRWLVANAKNQVFISRVLANVVGLTDRYSTLGDMADAN